MIFYSVASKTVKMDAANCLSNFEKYIKMLVTQCYDFQFMSG